MLAVRKEILSKANEHLFVGDMPRGPELSKIISSIKKIRELSYIARQGGLLILEEYARRLPLDCEENKFLKNGLILIVDGVETKILEDIFSSKLIVMGLNSFEAFNFYIMAKGLLFIQQGFHPGVILEELYSFLPSKLIESVDKVINPLFFEYKEKLSEAEINKYLLKWQTFIPEESDLNIFFKMLIKKIKCYTFEEMETIISSLDLVHAIQIGLHCDLSLRPKFSQDMSNELLAKTIKKLEDSNLEDFNLMMSVELFFQTIADLEKKGKISDYNHPVL